jgi:hypothetical protein
MGKSFNEIKTCNRKPWGRSFTGIGLALGSTAGASYSDKASGVRALCYTKE